LDIDWTLIASKIPLTEALIRRGSSFKAIPPREVGTPFRGSQLKDLCPRQEALCSFHEVWREDEIRPDLELIFAIGSGIHEGLQQRLLKDFLVGSWRCNGCGATYGSMDRLAAIPERCKGKIYDWEADELKPCPNHNYVEDVVEDWHLPGFDYKEIDLSHSDPTLYSHPDGILWRGEGEPPDVITVDDPLLEVLEIKSASERALKYGYGSSPPLRDEPYAPHKDQLMLYMYVLGIKFGRILYYDKAAFGLRSSLCEHTIILDQEYVEESILAGPLAVEKAIREKDPTLAPKVCTSANCSKARACPVQEYCWANDE